MQVRHPVEVSKEVTNLAPGHLAPRVEAPSKKTEPTSQVSCDLGLLGQLSRKPKAFLCHGLDLTTSVHFLTAHLKEFLEGAISTFKSIL